MVRSVQEQLLEREALEPKFLANWPQPLRWILILPASVLAYVLSAAITRLVVGFGTATVLAFGLFGRLEIMRRAMAVLDETSVSFTAFASVILLGTCLAPKFKWPVALLLGAASMALVAFSVLMSMAGLTARGYSPVVMLLINGIVAILLVWLPVVIRKGIKSVDADS